MLAATIAVYELADGETAVVAAEPFGPLLMDGAWRAAVPSSQDWPSRKATGWHAP